jgi:predicted RNA polymerase sigma factor
VTPERAVVDLLRRLAPQVVGVLARRFGDWSAAEDATQEALLAASTTWKDHGIPDHPKSWLITVASRRLIDALRGDIAAASASRAPPLSKSRRRFQATTTRSPCSTCAAIRCCRSRRSWR